MNQFPEKSLVNMTGKSNFDEVSVEELEKITNDYPYFSIGHLLLAKKQKLQNSYSYVQSAQRAALYIPSTWLTYYLETSAHFKPEDEPKRKATYQSLAPVVETPSPPQSVQLAIEEETATASTTEEPKVLLTDGDENVETRELLEQGATLLSEPFEDISAKALPASSEVEEPMGGAATENDFVANVSENEPQVTSAVQEAKDEPAVSATDENVPAEEITEAAYKDVQTAGNTEPITTEFTSEEIAQSGELAHETLSDTEAAVASPDGQPAITTEFSQEEIDASSQLAHETLSATDDIDQPTTFVLPETEELLKEGLDEAELTETVQTGSGPAMAAHQQEPQDTEAGGLPPATKYNVGLAEQPTDLPEEQWPPDEDISTASPVSDTANDEMLKNIKSVLDTPVPEQVADTNQPIIPIDPYYTVDYFASQGIRLVLDNEPQDKLGKQLRSFTQWLKHMKKVEPEEAAEENNLAQEAMVIRIADFSNIQREVVTETMAEVLEKQGKIEKAVQVYIKLSFLQPDKSAYFAAKIKSLKGIK